MIQFLQSEYAILLLLVPSCFIYYSYLTETFRKPKVNRTLTLASLITYCVLLLLFYIFVNNICSILLLSVAACILLAFNYKANFYKRVLTVNLYCLALSCIEHILFIIFDRDINAIPVWWLTIAKMSLAVCAFLGLLKFMKVDSNIDLPPSAWIQLMLIPIVSLGLFIYLAYLNIGGEKAIVFTLGFVSINFIAFRLYMEISARYAEKYKQFMLSKQKEYYIKQFEFMEKSLKERNAEKHDYKNHLSVISSLIQINEQQKALEYITRIINNYQSAKTFSYSGNLEIDSFINYKIQEAEKHNVLMNAELSIPENLQVDPYDMTTILGNIIDNAIQAASKVDGDRTIDLKVSYTKGRLLITMTNPFNGELKYENQRLVTLHEDKDNHGFGLSNVNAVLEKYNGTLHIEHTHQTFSITLLMFINKPLAC